MPTNRFRADTARAVVDYLKRSGMDPQARVIPPSRSLHGGCIDPGCCSQHPGVTADGAPMLSVSARVSARTLTRVKDWLHGRR